MEAMSYANFWEEQSSYIYGIAIVVTIIALAISTRYSLRNLFNIRAADHTVLSYKSKTRADDPCPCDATGNDGDDEAEGDEDKAEGDEDTTGESFSDRQQNSYHCLDPSHYYEHIQGEIKRVQQSVATRTIEQSLTEQQLLEEKEVRRNQLAEIFKLMQQQQEELGIGSMDDMQEQMKLYAV